LSKMITNGARKSCVSAMLTPLVENVSTANANNSTWSKPGLLVPRVTAY
jgi:hypothetical protein